MAVAAFDVVDAGAVLAEINEDFLCCVICLERYSDPKILPCQHTFCKKCLVQLAEKGVADTDVPVNDLQSNFFMSSLLDKIPEKLVAGTPKVCEFCEENKVTSICVECQQYSCTSCTRVHKKTKATQSHRLLSLDEYQETKNKKPFAVQPIQYCNVHTGNQLKYYCDTCQTPICMECTIIDHKVHQHRYIKEVADEYSVKLKWKVRKLKVKADETETSKKSAKAACEKLKTYCKEEEAKINKKTDEILADLRRQIEAVKQKKKRLVDQLKIEYTARVKYMEIKVDELEMKYGNIVSTSSYLETLVQHGNPGQILSAKQVYQQRIDGLITMETKPQLIPDLIEFKPHPGRDVVGMLATNACQQYCSLDNIPKQLIKGDTATFMVTTRDIQGKQVIPLQVVEARVTKPDGSSDDIEVLDNNNGTHTMMVHGEIDGKPRGIAIDNDGYVYVANSNNKVQKFDRSGRFICRIDKDNDGLNIPNSVAVTDDVPCRVVLADRGNHCVKIFAQ
ncbi:tripartite motif-containing protein 2-like [Saccoglossus kowalevskii]